MFPQRWFHSSCQCNTWNPRLHHDWPENRAVHEKWTVETLTEGVFFFYSSFVVQAPNKLVTAPDLCLKMSKCKLPSYLKKVWCSTQHFQRFLHDALLGASKKNDVSLHWKKKKKKKGQLETITIQKQWLPKYKKWLYCWLA